MSAVDAVHARDGPRVLSKHMWKVSEQERAIAWKIVILARAAVVMLLVVAGACAPAEEEGDGTGPSSAQAPGVARFVVSGEGSVRDTQTGLEWTSDDRGVDLQWHDAEAYCANLAIGGQADWRLPGIEELRALYDENASQPCGRDRTCSLDPAIELTAPYVWTGTENAPHRRVYLDFRLGTSLAPVLKPGLVRRTLCVRRGS
jgi:hypothetical protein